MTRAQILALVWLLSLLGTFWAGWSWRGDIAAVTETRAELKQSKGEAKAVEQARSVEHSKSAAMADIGERHEQDRQAAEAVPDSVVADLRADRYRLRGELASCETRNLSSAAATASQRDAGAVSREEIAGAAVRIARDADDQLRACQAVVRADRSIE
ncbi:Bacteriophage lysis protein [compost metagenome]